MNHSAFIKTPHTQTAVFLCELREPSAATSPFPHFSVIVHTFLHYFCDVIFCSVFYSLRKLMADVPKPLCLLRDPCLCLFVCEFSTRSDHLKNKTSHRKKKGIASTFIPFNVSRARIKRKSES